MKKLILLVLMLSLTLFSCTVNKQEKPVNPEVIENGEFYRSPEEEAIDKKLIMLLREQISTEHKASDAEFKYTAHDEVRGFDCFVYQAKSGNNIKNYAVALDETVIFEINSDGTYTEIYNVK